MKKFKSYLDIFVISGFLTSFFYGFLNPLYVSAILARLDGRIIAVGSFMSSSFPVLIGAILGKRKVFDRLYAILPAVMVSELIVAVLAALVAAVDLAAYYLLTMLILGVFSTSVVYLMQKIKEVRYRRGRAAFDRRCAMADAFGALFGSVLSIATISELNDPLMIAVLSAVQTVAVYGLFLLLYRKVPGSRKRGADEDPLPRRFGEAYPLFAAA
jgi:hypothetical protein